MRSGRAVYLLGLLGASSACTREPELAPLDRLELPTGLALDPTGEWLFVTNGNWDRSRDASGLVAVELDRLDAGLSAPRPADAELDREHPCRVHAEDPRIECDPSLLLAQASDGSTGVRLPSGAGNIAIDRPSGEQGPLRLLIPTRHQPGVTWVDVFGPGFGGEPGTPLRFECGQADDPERRCGRSSRVSVGGDPGRLNVDTQGFRFAYLPHLIGRRLTLLTLEGEPQVADVEPEFFRLDELFDSELGGGFAVLQRPCSPDNATETSLECARPFVLASQRFWPGMREFTVAPGLDVLIPGDEAQVLTSNIEASEPKPLMGGLAFEDPDRGERLLVVHTTPPALSRLDTSLDESGRPELAVLDTIPLCGNPNVIVVHRPEAAPRLALISCYGDDSIAVVDLGIFAIVATITVGDGPNELVLDVAAGHERLFVANTAESSISVIELSALSPEYLREIATLGLDTPSRSPASE